MTKPSKVLIIGSGPIIIGQAAEFDYAGTQACQALREEGVTSVLVNSNPATIMTDEDIADIVYIEPLTVEMRHPHHRAGAAGRPAAHPRRADRPQPGRRAGRRRRAGQIQRARCWARPSRPSATPRTASFSSSCCMSIGEPVPESATVNTLDEARSVRRRASACPLIIRPSYTLGGTGGGIAHTMEELERDRAPAAWLPAPSTRCCSSSALAGLERDRVRGDARRRRQLHHRLQHGELRPDGRAHRRQHRRRAQPDADRQGVPDAAHRPA